MKTVLLVEDDENDVFFIRGACERADIPHDIKVVTHGQAAIDYLSGANDYHDRHRFPLPALVLLDVKLPFYTGYEVLEWLRGQAEFKNLPVVMLTRFPLHANIERGQRLAASSYLVKDGDRAEFDHRIQLVLQQWLQMDKVSD